MKTLAALLVAVFTASLVVAGCGGESIGLPRGASVVPATAVAFVALDSDADSDQWKQAMEHADKFPGRKDALGSLEESVRSDSTLDFQRDIRPALGPEVDLVWLDLADNGQ